jgi:hypothetical protein
MAYTTNKNYIRMTFTDVREQKRNKTVELGGAVIVTDDDAADFDQVSKSAVRKYVQQNEQMDGALSPDADSEVRDTIRLYFKLTDDSKAHLDIPDPHDELFLSTTGPDAMIVKTYAVLAAAIDPAPEKALADIIDKVLAGTYLISDGETPTTYLSGERVTP